MEEMEEVWSEVFNLEQAGQHTEAAQLQETRLEEAHRRYDEAKKEYVPMDVGGGTTDE